MLPSEMVVVPIVFGMPTAVVLVKMWFRHKERMAQLRAPPVREHGLESRLERVEQAGDAIAVEMERVGEGQRFLTKLLSERSPVSPKGVGSGTGRE